MRNSFPVKLGGCFKGIASRIAATLLLAAFLFAPAGTPARADGFGNCAGSNILLELRKKDPSRYQTMMDDAANVRNGHSIFWKIEKPGVKPSWLFGTIHSSDERVLKLPAEFRNAFDHINTLVLELKEISKPNTIAIELLKHPELTMLPAEKPLDHILPAEETAQIAAALEKKGIPITSVLRMRPWFLYTSLLMCAPERNSNGGFVLDRQLAVQAENKGVDVEGLETPLEQFQAMADLPDDLTMKGLLQAFQLPYNMNDVTETLIALYLTGNSGLMKAFADDLSDEKTIEAVFNQRIITDRNEVMAKRIVPYLEKGNVMMAVGALHLPGDQGVVQLLRKQGYTLTAVN
ncbi:TraB/GumN family protein [Rhizobium rhizogenes]|uniref:TraB/GumN family protein n=1 Tax=Rhizobium rhizogenes TaxID=359 RepID=UPI00157205C8|nr:TraB/GumN family protein [Rhizobium rhizogenes]NTF43565.1 polysaccharide biosynthesis protein GumN [Rhizobium rhizogenes]